MIKEYDAVVGGYNVNCPKLNKQFKTVDVGFKGLNIFGKVGYKEGKYYFRINKSEYKINEIL